MVFFDDDTHDPDVTRLLRKDFYQTSNWALIDHARDDFPGRDGPASLAEVIDTSEVQASMLLAGTLLVSPMFKLAYHYGFMPSDCGSYWRRLPMDKKAFDGGLPKDLDAVALAYISAVLGMAGGPSPKRLAQRMDVDEKSFSAGLRRAGIGVMSDS